MTSTLIGVTPTSMKVKSALLNINPAIHSVTPGAKNRNDLQIAVANVIPTEENAFLEMAGEMFYCVL